MPNDPFRTRLLDGAIQHIHPDVRAWDTTGRLEHALAAEIDQDLERVEDPAFAEQFRDAVPIPGRSAADFRFQRFDLEGRAIIASIGFVGLNPDRPFVRIARMSDPVTSDDERDRLTAALAEPFEAFGPDRVRFGQPAHAAYQFGESPGDMRLVGGPVARMRALDVPQTNRVLLERATDTGWYDRYTAIYDSVHTERPWLTDVAQPESEEDMRSYVAEGLLFEIQIDGAFAGITGASAGSRDGLHGFNVVEIVIGTEFRGQHLGPAIQHHLAKSMPNEPGACLFGTIGADNRPALRAAIDAGRTDLAGDYWVPIQR